MSEREKIIEGYEIAREIFHREAQEAFDQPSLEDYMLAHSRAYKKFEPYEFAYKQMVEPKYSDIPDYGTHMTLAQFKNNCEEGYFCDSDGSGLYATETQMTDIGINPSDFRDHTALTKYSHVMWFNK